MITKILNIDFIKKHLYTIEAVEKRQ